MKIRVSIKASAPLNTLISCIHLCDPSTKFWKDQCTHGWAYILVLGHNVPGQVDEADVQGLNFYAAELTKDLKEMRVLGGPDDKILTLLFGEASDDYQRYDRLHTANYLIIVLC